MPDTQQAISWSNGDMLLIGLLRINFHEIWTETPNFYFKKICLKYGLQIMGPFVHAPNVLKG